MTGQPSFACPRCGYTTFLPSDIAAGYCPMCKWWTGDSLLGSEDVLAQAAIDGPFAEPAPISSPLDADRPRCSVCGREADIDIMDWTSALPVAYACEDHGEIRGDGSGEALPPISDDSLDAMAFAHGGALSREITVDFELTPEGIEHFQRVLDAAEAGRPSYRVARWVRALRRFRR